VSGPVDVLVVGAGPTGLALALQARAHGARVRIIERRPAAARPSRALIVHPRTLEQLRPLGVTEPLLAKADVAPEARLHLGGRVVRVRLADLALPDTAFPHLTLVRQLDVEAVLAQALAHLGVEVERGTELIAVRDGVAGARATLRSPTGAHTIDCAFVAGCDGPDSTVRRAAGIGWRGGPYGEEVVLADAELDADLAAGLAHVVVGRQGVVLVVALGERATWRLLATRPAGHDHLPFGQPGPPVRPAELQALLDEAGVGARITSLAWSARFPLQHRLAARFRLGRLYLAGDAAHAQSPATGQGMNTGIQDALNLGWKLALAGAATDRAALLDSYERERRPVARRVLALTHLAFWAEAGTGRPDTAAIAHQGRAGSQPALQHHRARGRLGRPQLALPQLLGQPAVGDAVRRLERRRPVADAHRRQAAAVQVQHDEPDEARDPAQCGDHVSPGAIDVVERDPTAVVAADARVHDRILLLASSRASGATLGAGAPRRHLSTT
jgi:2-polyprenyl-6-methoxyphenol hydroxylase-like FAD-dependent oxidoreductase